MVLLYSLTLALSAVLMFSIQPIMTKIVLPVLGGNPAVWNACVMFFQLILLAGYGYVHAIQRAVGLYRQTGLHIILLAVSIICLPIAVGAHWLDMPAQDAPVTWLVQVLAVTVGVPFFLLSANAPLVQSWLAQSRHPAASNPYMLYAASNLGSMIGLLAYPFAVEPMLTLSEQRMVWSAGYAVLVLMLIAGAWIYYRNRAALKDIAEPKETPLAPLHKPWLLRFKWVALAFVPSAMMLAVTSHITTDIAPIPLLWVLPLALYLLSFVLVFAPRPRGIGLSNRMALPFIMLLMLHIVMENFFLALWPWGVILIAYLIFLLMAETPRVQRHQFLARTMETPFGFFIPIVIFVLLQRDYIAISSWYLLGFFIISMMCHGRLSIIKPDPSRLTEFYFCLSLGGAMGGLFTALIAPEIFNGIYELPLCLLFAAAALPWRDRYMKKEITALGIALIAVLLTVAFYYGQYHSLGGLDRNIIFPINEWAERKGSEWRELGFRRKDEVLTYVVILITMSAAYMVRRHRPALLLLMGTLCFLAVFEPGTVRDVRYQDRNFFGVLQVRYYTRNNSVQLTNGTTSHGFQFLDPQRAVRPTSYYSWEGPLGAMVETMRDRPGGFHGAIGAIGLGTGTIACLAEQGQQVTFYDINPLVLELSAAPNYYFTYLRDCPAKSDVVMGDARLSMQKAPNGAYSLIVLDAFNSDAIPIHLMTKEALELYLFKLAPNGIIAYHVSNRHLKLGPVVGNLASAHGLSGITGNYGGSDWVFLARNNSDFGALTQDGRFKLLVPDTRKRTWTDDFSDIVSVINTNWF